MFQNKKSWLSGIVIFLITIQSLSNWVFYGVDKVARANKFEELYQQQVKDGQADEEFIA